MPRKGHKEGCQCRVCLAIAKKAQVEAAVVVAGPTFGSVAVGRLFEYPVSRFGVQTYRKCSVGGVTSKGTAINTTTPLPGGNLAIPFEEDAIIKPR